jgi:hypothetical protein
VQGIDRSITAYDDARPTILALRPWIVMASSKYVSTTYHAGQVALKNSKGNGADHTYGQWDESEAMMTVVRKSGSESSRMPPTWNTELIVEGIECAISAAVSLGLEAFINGLPGLPNFQQ